MKEEQWNRYYDIAKTYYETYGHLRVSYRERFNEVALGTWISRQRQQFHKGMLPSECVEKLERIAMLWEIPIEDNQQKNWDKMYQVAKAYYKRHGNLLVQFKEDYQGEKLGIWICQQRNKYKNHVLSEDRRCKLEELEIVWDLQSTHCIYPEKDWNSTYLVVKEYYEEYGFYPGDDYMYDGINIYDWVRQQCMFYEKGYLGKEQIKKLQEINIDFVLETDTNDYSWRIYYERLETIYQRYKKLDFTTFKKENAIYLWRWLYQQRQSYAKDELSNEKKQLLDLFHINWNIKRLNRETLTWDVIFHEVYLYYQDLGNLDVPKTRIVGNVNIAEWVHVQKKEYRKENHGKLTENQVEKLELIGFEES